LARLPDGRWVAFDDTCTHEECPLSEGDLEGERIVCYCHGSEFDLRTGEVLEGPAEDPLSLFPVRIEDGELQVALR
jgi:nitrite reductase/ring-hydroxylating ferredoxin subunit